LRQSWTGVHPDFRRQGIGTALKMLGIRYAREKGYHSIITAPRNTNAASIGMSLKVGFHRVEAQRGQSTAHG
jgi:RimJ/RimL family protein N-acetyltransferase